MLKYLSALAFSLTVFLHVNACDACACTSMNTLSGQLVPNNKSLFGIYYSYTNQLDANAMHIHNFSYSLFAGYSFAKRWQILANVPVQQIYTKTAAAKTWRNGLGDASLLLGYQILKPKENALNKHSIILRSGVKFPTGKYNKNDVSLSLGTGSFDALFIAMYIFERKQQGFNLNVNTRINTQNSNNFKYGNKYDASLFYFVKRSFKKLDYMPFAGVQGEYLQKDKSNGFIRTYSGGKAIYAQLGVQFLYNTSWSLYAKCDVPMAQNYQSIDGQLITNVRAQLQLNYIFSKKSTFKVNQNEIK